MFRLGSAGLGVSRQDKAWQARRDAVWFVEQRRVMSGLGLAGKAGQGMVRRGLVRFGGSRFGRQGTARIG